MASVRRSIERIKSDPTKFLTPQLILHACEGVGHQYRDRVLGPVETIQAMFVQAVHGNLPIGGVVRLHHEAFSASAYCQARQRIPLEVFFRVFHEQHKLMRAARGERVSAFHGHRVLIADSTGFSMPDKPALGDFFGFPNNQDPKVGFPVGRLMLEVEPATGMVCDFIPSPLRAGEPALFALMHPCVERGTVVLADSNFGTTGMLQTARMCGVHLIAEVHVARRVRFTGDPSDKPGQTQRRTAVLPDADEIMEWDKSERCPAWMDKRAHAALPERFKVRVIRHAICNDGGRKMMVVLVTTLLDQAKYPVTEVVELYKHRWRIETCIRTIKHTLNLDVLRSHTPHGVLKEIAMIVLVYNAVRLVMLRAAARQQVEPIRISFVDALRWMRGARPGDEVPRLNLIPQRPGRHEPRERKRRAKAYPVMQTPRSNRPNSRRSPKVSLN